MTSLRPFHARRSLPGISRVARLPSTAYLIPIFRLGGGGGGGSLFGILPKPLIDTEQHAGEGGGHHGMFCVAIGQTQYTGR